MLRRIYLKGFKTLGEMNSFFCILFIISFIGCDIKEKAKVEENSTATGEITITADEALVPIVDAEIKAFEAIYKKAKINVVYTSEGEAIEQLLNSKVNLAITSRTLTQEEIDAFKNKNKYSPKSVKIGIDALALITHKDNPDSMISYQQIQAILKGDLKDWKQINKQSTLKDIRIIFDNVNAASVRYLKDSVARVDSLPKNCYALNSNPKVIEYVSQTKNAIGIIGVSWISDRDDTTTRGFLDRVRVLSIAKKGQTNYDDFYQPYQAYIANGDYALSRGIYIINAEGGVRLASGFTAFVAGDKGQRIILKSGLVPATMPIRVVNLRNNPL